MQGNVLGQTSGGLKINGIIEEYKVASGGNVRAGDFVKYINEGSRISNDTLINSSEYSGDVISAVELSMNKIFIARSSTKYYYLYGMICTIQNNEITVECNVKLDNTSYCAKSISVVKIDHDKVFIAYSTNVKSVHAVMCTISDTTISLGTIKQIGGNYIYGDVHSAILLSENKIIVLHDEYVSTNVRKIYGIVCTISGTTITNGADTLLNSSSYAGFNTSAIKLSDNRIFIAHGRADFNLYASIYEITDTTITVVTDSTVISTNIHTSTPISTIKLSDNKVFIAGINANSLYAIICSINGALIEQGVEILLGDSNTYKISTLNLSENKLLIIQGGVNPLLGTICTIDGTNIILDKNISLNEEKESGWVIAAINLDRKSVV